MQYRNYGKSGYTVSAFGMGCMRLPKVIKDGQAFVDREKAHEMIRYAADNGVTYFDTALGYHNMTSEEVLGEALEGGRREKVKIATKQPFGAMKTQGDIRKNLESTLRKLRTDYIDVYLIHAINADTWEEIKKRNIIEEYEQFRGEGLIRAIGFSYHGKFDCHKNILDYYNWDMCQVQQNIIDVNREVTGEGIRYAGKKGCALVIMEPVRGGNLAVPPAAVQKIYDEYPERRSGVEWAFRHLLDYPEVSTILSGVSTMEQLKENITIFSKSGAVPHCLSETEKEIISRARDKYLEFKAIPCTSCEYCMPCPSGVNIPQVFSKYNDGMMFGTFEPARRSYSFQVKGGADASKCAGCRACEPKCPQKISIVTELKNAHEKLKGWIE